MEYLVLPGNKIEATAYHLTPMPETLSELEHLVLLSVMRLGEAAYGVSIQRELLETAQRKTARAAVYVALRRLEEQGYLHSVLAEPTAERGGRAKRFYALEERGLEILRQQQSTLARMWAGFEKQVES